MYRWRNLTPEQREAELAFRKLQQHPNHSPRHHAEGKGLYLITSTCYEHQPLIGRSDERMDAFSVELVSVMNANADRLDAWVVLPNHYHAVVLASSCSKLLRALGQLHGRTSLAWNGEDESRGRKVWFNTLDRAIRGDAHHIASVHYVHHNPVKHGHVKKWDDWKWSSAAEYIQRIGREEVERRWREYPLLNFGQGWDD